MTERAVVLERCRACGKGPLTVVLDLGDQPACDLFPRISDLGPDPRWPLALSLCEACGLAQLSHVSPSPEPPRAVESQTMLDHAADLAQRLLRRTGLGPGASVVEFASHHGGSLCGALAALGLRVLESGPSELVVDNHSIIHEERIDSAFADRVKHLSADGWLAIEFHHALAQVKEGQFDTVRHGHPVYLSLSALSRLASRHGLRVEDAWAEPVYGGCLVALLRRARTSDPVRGAGLHNASTLGVAAILQQEVAANLDQPAGYAAFASRTKQTCVQLRTYLERARDQGRSVAGYGAGSKACTLLAVAGIDLDLLPAVADLATAKHDRRMPGSSIPVISPEELVARGPDEVLVLTWDIVHEVVVQLSALGLERSRFVVPMPTLRQV